jgi:hypothetical protein
MPKNDIFKVYGGRKLSQRKQMNYGDQTKEDEEYNHSEASFVVLE